MGEEATGLDVQLDSASGVPIYVQLADQIRLLIRRGALGPGDSMPTVRGLAVALGVNANTVARVYRDLQGEGLLRLKRGVGTTVAQAGGEQVIEKRDLRAITRKARELVALARSAGLAPGELARLIETVGKED